MVAGARRRRREMKQGQGIGGTALVRNAIRPPIFVGEATLPMNIRHVYSSVRDVIDEYMGRVKVKLDEPYIHRFRY
jgi:hypothetical protein